MKKIITIGLLTAVLASPAFAQVEIDAPWVRATVPQQKVTGAFMRIKSANDARLVAARSPVAAKIELHEMVMDNEIMKMREVGAVELPAGETVEFKPGAHHIMLFGLKQPVRDGDTVPLELVVESKGGKRETLEVSAPVRPLHATHGGAHGQ